MEKYKYKFTVIVPVYKVEEYLSETLDSVINQTIGFEDNIQIIMVNDGSPDESEKICLEYVEKYPQNIKYVYQENAGVSAARNNGIQYIEGKYTNFLDSDDKWELDVFAKAWKMFEEHDEIDVIGVRQKFFEAATGYPSLDYKFDKDKVIDIFNNYDHIQLSVTSGFFRTSAIGDIRYDTRVKYSEDAKFINEIIIQKEHIGIISSSVHLYRKRWSENSAIQTKNLKDDWYLITPELCYKEAFELSKKKYGYVIPYFQDYIAYDYQWRLKEPIPKIIKQDVVSKYKEISIELLENVSDNIMLEQDRMTPELKIEYLKFKYGNEITNDLQYNNHCITYQNIPIYNLLKNIVVELNTFEIKKDKLKLSGLVNINIPTSKWKLYLVKNKEEKIEIPMTKTTIREKRVFDKAYMSSLGFNIELNEKDINQLYFLLVYNEKFETIVNFHTGINSKISSRTKIYYKTKNKIYYYYNKRISTKKNTLKNRLYFSIRNTKNNIAKKQWKTLLIRGIYAILRKLNRKEIWIVSDRQNVANDNGFALFKYITKQKNKKIKAYFVITKKSKYFEEVSKTGKYLIYNSLKYKLYFLLADKIISSQADDWTQNPFGKKHNYYHDLYENKFIFLQHGIIKDDLSTWLNIYEKKIDMFVTSTEDEYKSIINGEYGFDKDVVKLTGLPRYDLLENKSEKTILIMPTWRSSLATGIDSKTGKRKRYPGFENSEYCKFYNKLINDEELVKELKSYGYKGLFVSHPCHDANIDDFKDNETIAVLRKGAEYKELFKKANLLITDYSSVAFDFAYLNKPVLYTQFDYEDFFQQQIYQEGYYSYEKDGFGPVTKTYDKLKDEIKKIIKNDCKIEKKYQDRIKKTYKYMDKNNSKRIYEEIINLKSE